MGGEDTQPTQQEELLLPLQDSSEGAEGGGDEEEGPWGQLVPSGASDGMDGGVVHLQRRDEGEGRDLNEVLLGRSKACDVVVQDQRISSKHCRIYCVRKRPRGPFAGGLEVFLEDKSTNGTWVNGAPPFGVHLYQKGGGLRTRQIHTGDVLYLLNPRAADSSSKKPTVCTSFTFVANFHAGRTLLSTSTELNQSGSEQNNPDSAHEIAAASRDNEGTRRRVQDVYTVLEVIGSGTSGEVRRGLHTSSGREVAIKVIETRRFKLTPGLTASEIAQEANMLRDIEHPYIIKLEDIFFNSDHVFIILELVRGGDLFDRIVDRSCYSESEARELMVRVLLAVQYLHSKDIVHRDLKPENILMCEKENHFEVKITDFGLAKRANKEGLKTFCGTPQYFAPEVLKRRNTVQGVGRYGKEADLWSVGVILYIALSGTHPFHESTLFDQISRANYSFAGPQWAGVSDDAKDLIRKLLTKNPTTRLTANQALLHPFFCGRAAELAPEQVSLIQAQQGKDNGTTALETDSISEFSDDDDENEGERDQSGKSEPPLAPSKKRRMGGTRERVNSATLHRRSSSAGSASPKPLPMTAGAPRRAGSGSAKLLASLFSAKA